MSVSFGEPSWSEFLIVVGNERHLNALRNAFSAYPRIDVRFSDYIPPREGQARFHIEDGHLWQILDAAEWGTLDEGDSQEAVATREPNEAQEDTGENQSAEQDNDDWGGEPNCEDEEKGDLVLAPRGRLRAARADAKVGRVRSTIEDLFGLPEGSVILCGPDRKPLRADASIATLRRRWEVC